MSLLFLLWSVSLVVSLCFMFMSHPLAAGMTLLFQTILICVTSGLSSKFMWFSYILFLIFLGAMLVLFIYVASLASNESFLMSPIMMIFIVTSMVLGISFMFMDPLTLTLKFTLDSSFVTNKEIMLSIPSKLSMIYNPSTANLTVFIILYLLLTLVVVVKITSTFSGPLRPTS